MVGNRGKWEPLVTAAAPMLLIPRAWNPIFRILLFLVLLLGEVCLPSPVAAAAAAAGQTPRRNILILFSYHIELPWTKSFLAGLAEAKQRHDGQPRFFMEFMDGIRLDAPVDDQVWIDYLKKKYATTSLDAVIAESLKATRFLSRYGRQALGDLPTIFVTNEKDLAGPKTHTLLVDAKRAVQGTFDMAMRQNPDVRSVYVVVGDDPESRANVNLLLPIIRGHSGLALKLFNHFTVEELETAVARLPSNSLVFYTLVFRDRTGKRFVPKHVLARLAAVSSAPIYSFYSSLMGSGTAGGLMIDGHVTAGRAVDAVLESLDGRGYAQSYTTTRPYLDWRAVDRHGLDIGALPAGSIILHRPTSVLETFSTELLTGILVIMGLVAIILLMLVLRILSLMRRVDRQRHALAEGDEQFRQLFQNLRSGAALYEAIDDGEDFLFRDFNKASERLEGLERESVIGRRITALFPGVAEFGLLAILRRVWRTGVTENHPIAMYEDTRIAGWRENRVIRLPRGQVVAIYEDVSDKKRSEEALRRSEQRYRMLFNAANDAVFVHYWDEAKGAPQGTFIEVNDTACRRLGYSREELLHLSPADIDDPQTPTVDEALHRIHSDQSRTFHRLHVTKNGRRIPVEINACLFELDGRSAMLSLVRDMTDRQEMERELLRTRNRLDLILNSAGDGILGVDTSGTIIFANH